MMPMVIGIDASRAFLRRRTGIEEYSYQVIRHLRKALESEQVILYLRSDQNVDFAIPESWRIRKLWAPRFWTQVRLSIEMLLAAPDVLFVPAHTIPLIHPRNTVVTIHGLEYEFCRSAYSFWERWYMRLSIRFSCRSAATVICVSMNTKRDVMRLYGVPERKICVIYEGFAPMETGAAEIPAPPQLLFIGRLEERKNILRIIEAFDAMKSRHGIPHVLVLAGKPGYGYEDIRSRICRSVFARDIVELGYVDEQKKWKLLRQSEAFLFPSLYEGFGIPVLEAQAAGIPVVTSNISSLPEVGGNGAVYVDPLDTESLVRGMERVLMEKDFRSAIMQKAARNIIRFRWETCAEEIAAICMNRKI